MDDMRKNKTQLVKELTELRQHLTALDKSDATKLTQSEEKLRRFATVVRDSNDAITIQDFEGRITAWNHGAELMYGYGEAEALQMNIGLLTPPDKITEQKEFTRRLVAGKAITSFETQRVTKDGRILDVWLVITKLMDDTGKPIGIASTERDITERRREEEALLRQQDHLKDLVRERTTQLEEDIIELKRAEHEIARINLELKGKNNELEQIIYVSSHDLRSPLVNIQGFAKELNASLNEILDALKEEALSEATRKIIAPIMETDIPQALEHIYKGTAKIDALLNGLLRLSRLGRAAIVIQPLDMNQLLKNVVSATDFQIKSAGAVVTVENLPECRGDEFKITQVFSNLLDNALKYLHPNRPGLIKISGYAQDAESVYCVEDNGCGIAPEHQHHAFEIFHRLEPNKVPGEGLGLTIIKRIIERHSGRIWLESNVGKGSKFFVAFQTA